MTKKIAIKHTSILSAYLMIIWGFYRVLFKFPEEVEELFIKPVLWLVPIIYLVKKEKLGIFSLGFSLKNLFVSIYLSLILGIFFVIEGVIIDFIKYPKVNFSTNLGPYPFLSSFVLSLLASFSEEVTFRGYVFNRVWHATKWEWGANLIVSLVWALIYLPDALFWWELNFVGVLGLLILTMAFGIASSFVFARTKNIASSILLHVFWKWPIILFR